MNSEAVELNSELSELISAARRPATTIPRTPAGRTWATISGNAACRPASLSSTARLSSVIRSVSTRAKQIIPGMMKINTGRSFRKDAKMVPRLASCSFGAQSDRWTMYWSVHQYHSPMIGAQKSMPSHG